MLRKPALGALAVALFFITFSQVMTTSVTTIAKAALPPPTAAPSRTPRPPETIALFHGPYLDEPLTKEEAVQKAFEYDKKWAIWDKPWSVTFPLEKNGRVTVESYQTREYNGSKFGPSQEKGPVWVVTITGGKVKMIREKFQMTHGSVSYTFAKNTGHFLGYHAGP